MSDLAMIQQTATVFFRPGSVAEIRVLNTPRAQTVSGYFDEMQAFAKAAHAWSGKAPGVYATLNPCQPALLARAANRLKERVRTTTSDKDILQRVWFPLDFDPVRPADISSTDAEHITALQRAADCQAWLQSRGWPAPVAADSGNGAHRLYQIDLPNDDASTAIVHRCLEALALYFSDGLVSLDVTVSNAARIWKVYGTNVCKGDNLPERPHRLARLLDVPLQVEVVTRDQLEALAALMPAPPKTARHTSRRDTGPFEVEQWIARHAVPVVSEGVWQQTGYRWVLNPCPWNSAHTNKSAFIVRFASGAIAAGCQHNGCAENDWHALRDLYEPGWQTPPPPRPAPGRRAGHSPSHQGAPGEALMGQAPLPDTDSEPPEADEETPQQAAETLLARLGELEDDEEKHVTLERAMAQVAMLPPEAWMGFVRRLKAMLPDVNLNHLEAIHGATKRQRMAQVAQEVRGPAQAQLAADLAMMYADRWAYDLSRQGWMVYGDGIWSPLATELVAQQIGDFLDARLGGEYTWFVLSGVEHLLCTRLAQSLSLEPPGWLPFRNGALHLATMTLYDHSPDRSFTWQLPHAYDPQARCPKTQAWLHETVRGTHDQVQVLRAYAKAVVTRRVDLQRYLETLGPGGTGKGTYTRLLMALVGAENTFATELKHLETNRFELSQLRGKVLMVITDAERYSGPVNALKAITGQDFVRMEEKHKAQRTEIAPVMVVVAANEPIQSADYTSALVRRRLSMTFRHRPGNPRDLLSWHQEGWRGELASEVPGVINWVLALPDAQMEALLQQTTALVPSLQDTWAQALVETNPLADWANQALLYDASTDESGKPQATVKVGIAKKFERSNDYEHQDDWLYPHYRAWVDATGQKPLSHRRFSGLLVDLFENQLRLPGVGHLVDNQGSRFYGIRLRSYSDADKPLFITPNHAPARDGRDAVRDETRTSDGCEVCEGYLHNLFIGPHTPLGKREEEMERKEGGSPIREKVNPENPVLPSHPSPARRKPSQTSLTSRSSVSGVEGTGQEARTSSRSAGLMGSLPIVGDLVIPLAADGSQIPDNGTPYPYTVIAIETGPDGNAYALFRESPGGCLLEQCRKVESATEEQEERAAIAQFEGGLDRRAAEALAWTHTQAGRRLPPTEDTTP